MTRLLAPRQSVHRAIFIAYTMTINSSKKFRAVLRSQDSCQGNSDTIFLKILLSAGSTESRQHHTDDTQLKGSKMNKNLVLFLLYVLAIVVIAICGIRNAEHKQHIINLERVIEDGHYCVSKCVEMFEDYGC